MVTKTELNDFSLPENLLKVCPHYAELERQKTKTNIPSLPYKSEYTVRKGTPQEVTWLAIWLGPKFQIVLQYVSSLLQNSLNWNQDAVAVLPDAYIIRKPYKWDCVVSKEKEAITRLLTESYRFPEETLKEILEKS